MTDTAPLSPCYHGIWGPTRRDTAVGAAKPIGSRLGLEVLGVRDGVWSETLTGSIGTTAAWRYSTQSASPSVA